jgi:hypothetical protein
MKEARMMRNLCGDRRAGLGGLAAAVAVLLCLPGTALASGGAKHGNGNGAKQNHTCQGGHNCNTVVVAPPPAPTPTPPAPAPVVAPVTLTQTTTVIVNQPASAPAPAPAAAPKPARARVRLHRFRSLLVYSRRKVMRRIQVTVGRHTITVRRRTHARKFRLDMRGLPRYVRVRVRITFANGKRLTVRLRVDRAHTGLVAVAD